MIFTTLLETVNGQHPGLLIQEIHLRNKLLKSDSHYLILSHEVFWHFYQLTLLQFIPLVLNRQLRVILHPLMGFF